MKLDNFLFKQKISKIDFLVKIESLKIFCFEKEIIKKLLFFCFYLCSFRNPNLKLG